LKEAVADADLVMEVVIEVMEVKKKDLCGAEGFGETGGLYIQQYI